MIKKNKKYAIIGTIIILVIYAVFKLLHSPSFLLPIGVSQSEYNYLFRRPDNKYEVKYSFGNVKNSIIILDINAKYRCWIWRFNEYSTIPRLDTNCLPDSIVIDNYVDNDYGASPTLTTYNKMGNYVGQGISVMSSCYSNISSITKSGEYLSLYGEVDEIGVFSEGKCEVKFKFDRLTNSRMVFLKKETDFYILVLYGIKGKVLDEDTAIFNDFEKI